MANQRLETRRFHCS